ncbi:MAG: glycosyltransferase [Candidatus Nanoarchaeia archaeon]
MKIGIHMIVKDCASNLQRAIDSIYGFYDDLSIVDTGSTDETIDIAKRYTKKVNFWKSKWNHLPILDDFAGARNLALSKLDKDCDWHMWFDSDDVMSDKKEFRRELRKALKTKAKMFGCPYAMDYKTAPKIRGWKPDLFYWKYRIHEQIVAKKLKYREIGYFVKVPIYHLKTTKHGWKESMIRNLYVIEDCLKEEPDNKYYQRMHVIEWKHYGFYKKAKELANKYGLNYNEL